MDLTKEGFELLEPDLSFEPIPDGWYSATVERVDEKVSNAGNTYLNFVLNIAEGDHAGRKMFDGFHLWHPSATTVQISQRRLSSLFKACGYSTLGDTDDLIGEEVQVRVRKKPAQNGYEASNEIRDYRSAGVPKPPPATSAFGARVA